MIKSPGNYLTRIPSLSIPSMAITVVLDIGGGYFAFYAHLQKKSVTVRVGYQVKKGAVIGKLGNSGNTSGPHLYFHVMTGLSVLGSDGVPYIIDGFMLARQIDTSALL